MNYTLAAIWTWPEWHRNVVHIFYSAISRRFRLQASEVNKIYSHSQMLRSDNDWGGGLYIDIHLPNVAQSTFSKTQG